MDFECLAGLGFDPFAVDVGDILFEEGRVIKLGGRVSIVRK